MFTGIRRAEESRLFGDNLSQVGGTVAETGSQGGEGV